MWSRFIDSFLAEIKTWCYLPDLLFANPAGWSCGLGAEGSADSADFLTSAVGADQPLRRNTSVRGTGRLLVGSGEHAHESDAEVTEEEEAKNKFRSAYLSVFPQGPLSMEGFLVQRQSLLEYGSHHDGGQVRLRTFDVIEFGGGTAAVVAVRLTRGGIAASDAAASGGRQRSLQPFGHEVVGGGVGQNPRCVQEEQHIDQDGNGGDHDPWEGSMVREAVEGRDEEQAEPDETEGGLFGVSRAVRGTYTDDLRGEHLDFHLDSNKFDGPAREVARYTVADDQADGKDNEERVKAASQHA
ncbi:uncharacterized protein PG986_002922 [Apiospora aurea]|uniref:Uncharacterized protein n=1 Tax=Apiospora aurea TaxID=335848 RepID=A0ABR1QR16_9PEZI